MVVMAALLVTFLVLILLVTTPCFCLRFKRGAGAVVMVIIVLIFCLLAGEPAMYPALSAFLFLGSAVVGNAGGDGDCWSNLCKGGEEPGEDSGETVGLWMVSGLMKLLQGVEIAWVWRVRALKTLAGSNSSVVRTSGMIVSFLR
jgi:hypothetical protein